MEGVLTEVKRIVTSPNRQYYRGSGHHQRPVSKRDAKVVQIRKVSSCHVWGRDECQADEPDDLIFHF